MLGLISGIMEFVPAIGPVIAALPGVMIAIFLGSSWLPIPNLWFALVVGLTYFLQQFENLYLVPRVVGSRVRLHPAVVIVGVLAASNSAAFWVSCWPHRPSHQRVFCSAMSMANYSTLNHSGRSRLHHDRSLLWKEFVPEHRVCAVFLTSTAR